MTVRVWIHAKGKWHLWASCVGSSLEGVKATYEARRVYYANIGAVPRAERLVWRYGVCLAFEKVRA